MKTFLYLNIRLYIYCICNLTCCWHNTSPFISPKYVEQHCFSIDLKVSWHNLDNSCFIFLCLNYFGNPFFKICASRLYVIRLSYICQPRLVSALLCKMQNLLSTLQGKCALKGITDRNKVRTTNACIMCPAALFGTCQRILNTYPASLVLRDV